MSAGLDIARIERLHKLRALVHDIRDAYVESEAHQRNELPLRHVNVDERREPALDLLDVLSK